MGAAIVWRANADAKGKGGNMDKTAMKDSFERMLQEADGAYLWDRDDSPIIEDWELFDDPLFLSEVEHILEKNLYTITTTMCGGGW